MVDSPMRRKRGRKYRAVPTIARAAVVSHAVTAMVWLKASPLRPMRCSVDRLVSISDPAMTHAVRLRPPKKYASHVVMRSRRV